MGDSGKDKKMNDEIKSYTVREPGHTAWQDDIETLDEAREELAAAHDVGLHKAEIFGETADGRSVEIEDTGYIEIVYFGHACGEDRTEILDGTGQLDEIAERIRQDEKEGKA